MMIAVQCENDETSCVDDVGELMTNVNVVSCKARRMRL